MTIGKKVKERLSGKFTEAKKNVELAPGEVVKELRELNGLSQNELAEITGIPQSTISSIEKDRVNLGAERAKVLARALRVHPAVILFPGWDTKKENRAS